MVRCAKRVAATHPAWSMSPNACPPNSVPRWFVRFGMTISARRTSSKMLIGADGSRAYTCGMFLFGNKKKMPEPADALPGRPEPIPTAERSLINDQPVKPPYPEGSEIAEFALGCFWG